MPTPHAHHARRTAGTLLVVLALAGCASGNTPAPAPPTPTLSPAPSDTLICPGVEYPGNALGDSAASTPLLTTVFPV